MTRPQVDGGEWGGHPPLPQGLLTHFHDAHDFFGGSAKVVHASGHEEGWKERGGSMEHERYCLLHVLLQQVLTLTAVITVITCV